MNSPTQPLFLPEHNLSFMARHPAAKRMACAHAQRPTSRKRTPTGEVNARLKKRSGTGLRTSPSPASESSELEGNI